MINKALVKFYKCLYLKYLWKYRERDAENDELRMAIKNIKAELDTVTLYESFNPNKTVEQIIEKHTKGIM